MVENLSKIIADHDKLEHDMAEPLFFPHDSLLWKRSNFVYPNRLRVLRAGIPGDVFELIYGQNHVGYGRLSA